MIQAMPGPMFNLSAYLGATIAVRANWNFLVGVAACWLGLFGPGALSHYQEYITTLLRVLASWRPGSIAVLVAVVQILLLLGYVSRR
jgi:hypothetical protein